LLMQNGKQIQCPAAHAGVVADDALIGCDIF
jgi:hypothetical protein